MKKRSKAKKRNKRVKARCVQVSKTVAVEPATVKTNDNDGVTKENDKASVAGIIAKDNNKSIDEKKRQNFLDSDNYISLEQAKEYWLLGEWEKLVEFDLEFLQEHPDRAWFILLVGSAWLQLGDVGKGEKLIRISLDKGCSRANIGEVLIAGINNTLGCVAILLTDKKLKAKNYFSEATQLIRSDKKEYFLSYIRFLKENIKIKQPDVLKFKKLERDLDNSDMESKAKLYTKIIYMELERKNSTLIEDGKKRSVKVNNTLFSKKAHSFYKNLSNSDVPFILLDSKSLPRSGLHYMKKTFSSVLGDDFSFCEWYQEAGCCGMMPCLLNAYAKQSEKDKRARLRLLKSHDFNLSDPAYSTENNLKRIIIIRSPLFLLTSWFMFEQLNKHNKILSKHGIGVNKIYLSHERDVVKHSYDIVDDNFIKPNDKEVLLWLDNKTKYIASFLDKWVKPYSESKNAERNIDVITYDNINSYIVRMLNKFKDDDLSLAQIERIDFFAENCKSYFTPRVNPFALPSKELSNYIFEKSEFFMEAAAKVYVTMPSSVKEKYFWRDF